MAHTRRWSSIEVEAARIMLREGQPDTTVAATFKCSTVSIRNLMVGWIIDECKGNMVKAQQICNQYHAPEVTQRTTFKELRSMKREEDIRNLLKCTMGTPEAAIEFYDAYEMRYQFFVNHILKKYTFCTQYILSELLLVLAEMNYWYLVRSGLPADVGALFKFWCPEGIAYAVFYSRISLERQEQREKILSTFVPFLPKSPFREASPLPCPMTVQARSEEIRSRKRGANEEDLVESRLKRIQFQFDGQTLALRDQINSLLVRQNELVVRINNLEQVCGGLLGQNRDLLELITLTQK